LPPLSPLPPPPQLITMTQFGTDERFQRGEEELDADNAASEEEEEEEKEEEEEFRLTMSL
jgi:ribosomal protein L12E/L44/L45/RPP1/RPP2